MNFQEPHPGFNLFGAHITTSQWARPSDRPSKDTVSDKIDVPQWQANLESSFTSLLAAKI
ncbi:hypothetical protein MJO28_006539 [Puccinia striiformis f. sp. tritici]|uniref:Uncharacterized protein n=1 Tax=Puccinia striiformis f. sp. tritici TaxID=168172 RepID=A0ACC0EJG2_9BASI|nr:hypothetical protein MJO28_006539 [Puccinia striiformis f. sp. tritici]